MRKRGVVIIEAYQNITPSARLTTHGRCNFNLHKDTNTELTVYYNWRTVKLR